MKYIIISLTLTLIVFNAYSAKEDCRNLVGPGPEPIRKVNSENLNVRNDYETVVAEDTRDGVTYLSFIGGSEPVPNACGLNPKNARLNWAGWGGPVDTDNASIGHGIGRRNEIVIGGVYFERGLGIHANAKIIYDLTGGDYVRFEAYVGMSDETDPNACGNGGSSVFTFNLDGRRAFQSEIIQGVRNGLNIAPVKVAFDIPTNAKELEIIVDDAGDTNCADHAMIADAKLLDAGAASGTITTEIPTTTIVTTDKRIVRVIHFVPRDRTPLWNIHDALNIQLKEVQQVYAEQLEEHGYGRKTFEIETDNADKVIVHSITGSYSDAYYHTDTLKKVSDEVKTRFDVERDVYLIVIDSSKNLIEGYCGIAYLDGGPALVISAGNCVDGDYGITLIAHELGHAFNLEHDFRDDDYFMSYGNSRRKFSACAAAALRVSPFLNQDDPVTATSNTLPTMRMISEPIYPENGTSHTLQFEVNDVDGIHLVQFIVPRRTIDPMSSETSTSIYSCKELNDVQSATVSFELPGYFMTFPSNSIHIRVFDAQGGSTSKEWVLTAGDIEPVVVENYTDVNSDGVVNLVDLVIVASRYGERITGDPNPNPDVNRDGIVNVQDLILVANELPIGSAPLAQLPIQTHLFHNYPNPFNPETWIPYVLSDPTDVAIEIYTANGSLVRRLAIGYQSAGLYINKASAVYWDGRNAFGEPVASGLYFYTFIAGDYAATRKMLIRR